MPMTDTNIAHRPTPVDQALPVGTVLSGDQFTVTEHLGAGGFGITYRAKDNVLGRTIVIKECFPEDFCLRDGKNVVARSAAHVKPVRSIVNMFMREARSLAKLRHPNIVGVHRAFEENQTAYMVLDLIDGRELFDILQGQSRPLTPSRVKDILLQLLDAIETVHDAGLLHRDISPDNIILEKTGTPVLIDFGAARADASHHTRAVSSLLVVKDGYSPQEFYVAGSVQAPCSDLYALAATFYHVLSGEAPPNSQTRLIEIASKKPDPCRPLAGRISGYDDAFLEAIDAAMQIHPDDRLQSAAKWRSMIVDDTTGAISSAQSGARPSKNDVSLELELSLTKLVAETNDVVRQTSQVPDAPEPVALPPEKPAKPAWIEEFNQETLTPTPRESRSRRTATVTQPVDLTPQTSRTTSPTPQPKRSETNWIGKAMEKQEQIRIEREEAFAEYEARTSGRRRTRPSRDPVDLTAETAEDIAPPEASTRSRLGPMGLVLGLMVCFYFVFVHGNS